MGGGGCKKSGKIDDVVYGCSLFNRENCMLWKSDRYVISAKRNRQTTHDHRSQGRKNWVRHRRRRSPPSDFGKSVNPISTRGEGGADYAHVFSDLPTALYERVGK